MIQPLTIGKSSFALLLKKMVNEIIGIHTYERAGGGRQVQEKTENRSYKKWDEGTRHGGRRT
jgi:hypothetical protein